ncbi:hypothetical protein [Amycolatopsis orientalis]|uniref:hypothetical protein n=1 Tax=Amycolatopsis orientalis TaxID=31958 RepID=UPI0003A4802B|nr:hypothetical protein [Amycolatopsis orientalis]
MTENRGREVPLSYVVTLLVGVVLGVLLARFGGLVARYPVESTLVAVLVASVAVLAWACREMLHDLVRRGRPADTEETESAPGPRLSAHRPPNGVRR